MHVERTFTVPRAIADVFTFLSDFENTESWDPGTVETTRTSGDGGLGTTYRNRSTFMGRTVELDYETIVFDEPTAFAVRGVNGKTTTFDRMSFLDNGAGETQITYRAEFEFPFPLSIAAPLILGRKLDALADETVAQITSALTT